MINFLDISRPPIDSSFILSRLIGMGLSFIITFTIGLVVLLIIKSIKNN